MESNDVFRNLEKAERGEALDVPLRVLNGDFMREWKKRNMRAYYQSPEYKAHMRAYYQSRKDSPEYKAHMRAYYQSPEYKAHKRAYNRAYRAKRRLLNHGIK